MAAPGERQTLLCDHLGSVFSFEAFNEPWLSVQNSWGPHWGLWHSDRTPKFSIQLGKQRGHEAEWGREEHRVGGLTSDVLREHPVTDERQLSDIVLPSTDV